MSVSVAHLKKKENKKFPVHFSFRKARRRRLMIISELTSSITKTFQTLASFVSDQTFLFLALQLDHNTQARTIFPQSLGSGGGLEVECSQMKTEGPGSIPIPGVDFFKSSHRFSALGSATPTLDVRISCLSLSLYLYLSFIYFPMFYPTMLSW